MSEIIDEKLKRERFGQLFEMIGDGLLEYIALSEYCLGIDPKAKENNNNKEDNKNTENNPKQTLQISIPNEFNSKSEQHLLLQNLKLYKLQYQRMVKLRKNYAGLRLKLERVSTKSTESINDHFNSSRLPNFKLFSFSRFCKCPSPQRQKLYSKQQQFASSTSEIQKIGIFGKENFENFGKPFSTGNHQKSQSLFDLTNNKQIEKEVYPKESVRTIRAEMTAIESETCGMLGRLQFHVQAIIGFARICTGDVFEVSIRHGHQRWRTRGKTQPDRSQRWDQQPPIASIQILWNVPIQVRVLEIGFLRARCLSERQFDPAKFAAAQPQLVTMNLNNSGSLKLRLVVTWLPLLSSKIPSQSNSLNQKQLQAKENGFNNHASLSQQNSSTQRPELPQRSAMNGKIRQHQSQVILSGNNNQKIQQNGVSIWRTTSGNSPSAFPSQVGTNNKTANTVWHNNNNQANTTNNNEQINGGKPNDVHPTSEHSPSSFVSSSTTAENGPATKVCLRDKKRQREQRLKLGASVGAALGGGGISRESSKTERDRWRCSSTTLLDEVYKDLSKSIPTIDDLSALHSSKPSSICGGSLGHSKNAFAGPSSSSSASEGHGARSGAKRIFSFVKRGGHDKSSLDRTTASDWRKSVSLAQIPQSRSMEMEQSNSLKSSNRNKSQYRLEVEEPEEPEEFDENEREELRDGTRSPKSRDLHSPTSHTFSSNRQDKILNKEIRDFESALQTVDALLDMIECLRVYLAKLRPSEFTELVAFEAAMLNWEACLKLNRSGILCQLDNFNGKTDNNNNKKRQNSIQLKRQKQRLATGNLINHSSNTALFSNENRVNSQHSPSTASDHTEDDGAEAGTSAIKYEQRQHVLDHISENDSGIDSLRQYQSPYNSYASSARRLQQNNEGTCIVSSQIKERRKSLVGSTMLNNENGENENLKNSKEKKGDGIGRVITATGSAQMDACLAIHLDGARQPLEIICQVQGSPFEYTMTKMLYRMEGVETIALESMLGLLQDILAQWQPNPQNVLLQLGLQFQLQQCWLSACKTEQEFLLASASVLREKLRPICEPIVRNHYPNLVEKVLDSLFSLLVDSPTTRKKQQNNSNHQLPITIFQFVSLFRGKQFSAFIENLSHEAWITANLQSGLPSAIRDVMGRLRNVPVVPPLESLRHIGLVLAEQHQELYSPIEKYLRKASPELALDLSACFMCLLENENESSRKGACRALAILGAENSLTCLDFLSHSDCNKSVRMEAEQASLRIRRLLLLRDEQQQVVTKI